MSSRPEERASELTTIRERERRRPGDEYVLRRQVAAQLEACPPTREVLVMPSPPA